MAETQLITISNVQTYRKIQATFETDRFNAFVNEIQRKNLRELLGDALYYDFMNSERAAGTAYYKLLNGDTYIYEGQTIKFYGLIPVLVYWFLALAMREGELFLTNYGGVSYIDNPQQQFTEAKIKERIALDYINTAQGYAADAVKWLDTKSIPLWQSKTATNGTEFLTFRI